LHGYYVAASIQLLASRNLVRRAKRRPAPSLEAGGNRPRSRQ